MDQQIDSNPDLQENACSQPDALHRGTATVLNSMDMQAKRNREEKRKETIPPPPPKGQRTFGPLERLNSQQDQLYVLGLRWKEAGEQGRGGNDDACLSRFLCRHHPYFAQWELDETTGATCHLGGGGGEALDRGRLRNFARNMECLL